jgi:CRISPR-associated protein Csm1
MSLQILLQGRILGTEAFLLSGPGDELDFAGRAQWLSLLSEVLPRAIIAELGLSKMLLGSSGGEQFLMVLPEEVRAIADDFFVAARASMQRLSGGTLNLIWAVTENLGDWTVVRKRLNDELLRKQGTPLGTGDPTAPAVPPADPAYFAQLGEQLRHANSIAWNPDSPAALTTGAGKHTWAVGNSMDALPLARHTALTDDDNAVAEPAVLGRRAEGGALWGVLRGDVDDFGIRMRRLQTIEEHVQISVMYKQFFAGELEVLASLPDFWRKVTLLYAGGDDFAIYGAWDSLIAFARELKRLFHRFSEEKLKDFPGQEGKTITMALALAPEPGSRIDSMFERAGEKLAIAKATDKDCFNLLGRTLEWKQVSDAGELKDQLTRMVTDFGASPEYIRELCGIYRETKKTGGGQRSRVERPWRFHRRLNRILGTSRSREYQKARASLVTDLAGKNPANLKLRPSGRVALEWARLATERREAAQRLHR